MDTLEIRLLGTFEVTVDGVAVPPGAWAQRRAADLVKLLALAPRRRLPRDQVLEALWPHLDPKAAAAALHKAAHYARRALGDRDGVVLAGGAVALAPRARATTDVERFEEGGAYPGGLLPDDRYEAWTDEPRARLHALAVERERAAGRWAAVLALDPVDEDAHRRLMLAAAQDGDRSGVVRWFAHLRDALAGVGAYPSPETVGLLRRLSRGPAVRAPVGAPEPMPGRALELSRALAVLDAAERGEGGVLALTGEAGSGKTRLAEAVLLRAGERRLHTVRASASEAVDVLGAAVGDLVRERPELAAAGDGPLARGAAERGCVVLLDDLQEASDAAVRDLLALAAVAATQRLLLVLCWRPSEARASLRAAGGALTQRRLATVIALEPLGAGPRPATRYATTADGARIAFQVAGDGPVDVALVPGFVSNVEYGWEMPVARRMYSRIAARSRLILWDKRGTGLSDPVRDVPTLDERMLDLTAVLDAAGSERAVLFGVSEGGPMSLLFAERRPERVEGLVLYGTAARFAAGADHPRGWDAATARRLTDELFEHWGTGRLLSLFVPSLVGDPDGPELFGRFQRAGASPSMGRAMTEAMLHIDVRDVLPRLRVPTLVVHRAGDRLIHADGGRLIAATVPGAVLVELEGEDHFPFLGDMDDVVDEVEAFVAEREAQRATLAAR